MTLYLVRHAKAGSRSHHGSDDLRPLTPAGETQAARIAELLADAGIERIVTSRYTRCMQTVEPLGMRLRVPVEIDGALAEEADIEETWALLEKLSGTVAAVCSHGNVLGAVLDRVHRRGADIEASEWSCHKGSVWRLEPDASGGFRRAVLELPQA